MKRRVPRLNPGDHVLLRGRHALALLRLLSVEGPSATAEAPNGEVVDVVVAYIIRPIDQHSAGMKFEAAAAAGRGIHARPAR